MSDGVIGSVNSGGIQKSPVNRNGAFPFLQDRSPFSVADGSYSGRTGSCNEMTEQMQGGMLDAYALSG